MDDVSNSFMTKTVSQTASSNVSEMEEWMASASAPPTEATSSFGTGKEQMPPLKPLRRKTDDAQGRPKAEGDSLAGKVMRNVSEVPGAVVRGVHDAIANATRVFNPLTNWLDENVVDLRYDPNKVLPTQDTPTGAITREAAKFLTGFIPAAKALKVAGMGSAATGLTAGAISDFATKQGNEARLSDWWKQSGLPQNVLTDYLSSKPDDSETEGRLKNAIEGLGLGTLTEGVFRAASAIRAARQVKGAEKVEIEYLKGKYGEVTDEQLALTGLGDVKKPVVEVGTPVGAEPMKLEPRALIRNTPREKPLAGHKTTELGDVIVNESAKEPGKFQVTYFDGPAKEGAIPTQDHVFATRAEAIKAFDDAGAGTIHKQSWAMPVRSEDFDVYINFARFDEPDQIKFAIGKMAEAAKGSIDEATRGKITQTETLKMAEDLGMSVDELLSRRKGQGFNAEEAVAARQLWAASGDKLVELARKAAGPDASALDHFAFRKMMATHSAIQAEVIGARTETARALASWAIPVKGGAVEKARLVDQVLQSTGGVGTSQEMAKRLAMLAEAGAEPAAIARFAFKGHGAATVDAIKELWVNGLLSAPKTHVVNVTSNTITAMMSVAERQVAGMMGNGVHMGEAASMAYGLVSGLKDSWRLAAQYLRTGQSKYNFSKVDIVKPDAISSEALNISKSSMMGRFVDYLGKVVGTPMHVLGAEDEFFKSIGYRMEVHAQSLRQAAAEGHRGAALGKRMAELVNNPSEAIRINAADAALYQTFTNEMGAFGKAVMNLRNIDHPLNPAVLIVPFVRTPANIARYAFERTPFAPLVSQWRADIAAGGARADLALARMSTGTAIMMMAMDMADAGHISGGGPQGGDEGSKAALARQGWKPYSVKLGDRWFAYDRMDPLGMTIGFAASITESIKKGEVDEDDIDEWQEVTAMTIAAVSQVAISKTYLEGMAKFIETMSDPKRHSERYVSDMFASFLPATSLNASVKNLVDPVQRETNSPIEAVYAKIAGLSDKLPPRRDLWGKEMSSASGLGGVYDMFSPTASKAMVDSPIDKEIVRLGDGPSKIAKKTLFNGVQVNFKNFPKAYDEYVRLAGNDLKHPGWGVGAKDYLDAVVSGKHPMSQVYSMMSDDSRAAFIKNTVQDYRRLAQQQVINDPRFVDFAKTVDYLKAHKLEAKMPMLGE